MEGSCAWAQSEFGGLSRGACMPPSESRPAGGPAKRRDDTAALDYFDRVRLWGFIAFLSLSTTPAIAQTKVTLPLEGWYRIGRYVPMRVEGAEGQHVAMCATGAVPTILDSPSASSFIAPLLTYGNLGSGLTLNGRSIATVPPLRPLASHQQLVLVAGDGGDRLAKHLFPGESIVSLHVSPDSPLPGPPVAWQSVDAVIITTAWPAGINTRAIPALLAGGMQIAVASATQPDMIFPWESIEGGWVLRPPIAGPLGCDGSDDAYLPAAGWHPDLPASVRMQVVLAGGLIAMAFIAARMLPSRATMPAMAVVTTGACVAIALWQSHQSVLFEARGDVKVESQSILQTDHWRFFAARAPASGECDCSGITWPICANTTQPGTQNVTLHWEEDRGWFTFSLPTDGRIALLTRDMLPREANGESTGGRSFDSPMAGLARSLYRHGRESISLEGGSGWSADASGPVWATARVKEY